MIKKQAIAVIGCGSWGGTIAQYLSEMGHIITVWHVDDNEVKMFNEKRTHPFIPHLSFSSSIHFTSDLKEVHCKDILVIAVPSHIVRKIVGELSTHCDDAIIVNLAKGIENDTLMRMSEVIISAGFDEEKVVSLYGPSHAEEVAKKIPTTVVAAGKNKGTIEFIQQLFSSDSFRIYTNQDIVGVELGGSIKNIIAIAAGICDGIGFGDNTKAALITRGIVEITRLGTAMEAKKETFAGLSGLGDLIVTCLSRHSRNRFVGEEIGKGRKLSEILNSMEMIAEGINTAKSVHSLMNKYSVEMPICNAVYLVLFEDIDPMQAVKELMNRELIYEH